jgi:hypothetical protein
MRHEGDSNRSILHGDDHGPQTSSASSCPSTAPAEVDTTTNVATPAYAAGPLIADAAERRRARDNKLYTEKEFEQFYGAGWRRQWAQAACNVQRHTVRNRGRACARTVEAATSVRSPEERYVLEQSACNSEHGRTSAVATGTVGSLKQTHSSTKVPAWAYIGIVSKQGEKVGGKPFAASSDIDTDLQDRENASDKAHPQYPFTPGKSMPKFMECRGCHRKMHVSHDNNWEKKVFACENCWKTECDLFQCPECYLSRCTRCIAKTSGDEWPAAVAVPA